MNTTAQHDARFQYEDSRPVLVSKPPNENKAARLKCLKHKPAPKVPLSFDQWRDLALALHALEAEREARARRVYGEEWQRFAALSATRACIALLICAARSCEVITGLCSMWRPERSQLLVPTGKTGPQLIVFGEEVAGVWMSRQVTAASKFGRYILVALHHLRATAACTALELGVPLTDVQVYLCHRKIETTEIYTQLANNPGQKRVAREVEQCRIQHAPDVAAILRSGRAA